MVWKGGGSGITLKLAEERWKGRKQHNRPRFVVMESEHGTIDVIVGRSVGAIVSCVGGGQSERE